MNALNRLPTFVVAGLGAAIGACGRYFLYVCWGTPLIAINMTASFIFGLLSKRGNPVFWTVGVCGGFSSFSSYIALVHGDLLYAVPTLIGCFAACIAGMWCGTCFSKS